ncbi:MAG: ATP-binding cassette domain-containing protein, partial [Actinomycetota bacterium]|nr:ATP-binding cassette domain-containing protein [Actinomycetota bacterium]
APARTRKPKARIAAATGVVKAMAAADERVAPLDLAGAGARQGGTPRLGDKVILLHGVGHGYGEDPWLFTDLDLDLDPGGRLGIVGPNGSGKSTLLDILSGRVAPSAGSVEVGPTVRVGYYAQNGLGGPNVARKIGDLDPTKRVRDAVAGAAGQPTWEQVRLMERFWFDEDLQWAPVGTLSGGEQRRLQLLLVLAELPNVLLLDEPTNDLDLDTLRALEEYFESWPGSLVVVSHDRAHLERTVEDVLLLDGQGHATVPPGGFAGYEARRRAERTRVAANRAGDRRVARAAVGGPPAKKLRSPSTLRRLLAEAERDLEEATAARDRLVADLEAVADHVTLARLAEELATAEVRVGEVEERWLALAEELGS